MKNEILLTYLQRNYGLGQFRRIQRIMCIAIIFIACLGLKGLMIQGPWSRGVGGHVPPSQYF